ncbi:hypothetical protein JL475_22515 [Streptomyces sp. M2CJ-2]|uniref:hypothetical protein n=1 Tax=Streptomyces sp. M2CJ-2 TaxID=2803948 RepID=UPI00192552F5|nr:hypothetical protein [Streptomyces sp. M2CJ-2]MBL3668715.1 hypothetical protein [Streptomyces sp. M2CJ-2]
MANGSTLESSDSPKAFGAGLKTFRERALLTREQRAERLDHPHASVAARVTLPVGRVGVS